MNMGSCGPSSSGNCGNSPCNTRASSSNKNSTSARTGGGNSSSHNTKNDRRREAGYLCIGDGCDNNRKKGVADNFKGGRNANDSYTVPQNSATTTAQGHIANDKPAKKKHLSNIEKLEAIRIQKLDKITHDFQNYIDAAEKLRHEAQHQCQYEHDTYYAKGNAQDLELAEKNIFMATEQLNNALNMKQVVDNLLLNSDQRIEQLTNERNNINIKKRVKPHSLNLERWSHKEHEINLANHEKAIRQHAANIVTEHIRLASHRAKETTDHRNNLADHFARIKEIETQRQEHEKAIQLERQEAQKKAGEAQRHSARQQFEHDVSKSQDESEKNHQQAVKNRHEESVTRNDTYDSEIKYIHEIISQSKETFNFITSVEQKNTELQNLSTILKVKKEKTETWLYETQERLTLQQSHLSMINNHFNHCINIVNTSDLEAVIKERLIKRWNDLRNIELNNKNTIISRSEIELDKIKYHISIINQGITYSNKKLPEVNSPADRLSFFSTTQHTLKEKEISVCDTADCEVGANVKPVAGQGVTLSSSQALAIAGTATLAPAEALIKGSTALAELNRIAFLSAGPMALAGAALFYSKPVGVGSDRVTGGKDFRQTLQIGDLDLTVANIVGLYAQGEAWTRSNIRGRLANINGAMHVELYKTEMPTEIRLLAGIPVGKGVFTCAVPATDDYPARTILVTPDRAPGAKGLGGLATPSSGLKAIADTGNQSQPVQLPTVTTYPDLSETDFNDLIVVPPLDSGYKPVYVMFASPRDLPGTVTGQGQKVGVNWLADAATEQGAPIPEQIADKMRGSRFNSFDAFRKSFWIEVSKNPELSNQFGEINKENIKNGTAPATTAADRVGGRLKFEIHHVQYIKDNGAVYGIDNLRIMTPKQHIDSHSKRGGK